MSTDLKVTALLNLDSASQNTLILELAKKKILGKMKLTVPRQKSFAKDSLIDTEKVYLPLLAIKIELMKYKKTIKTTPTFPYLKQKFPKINEINF